MMTNTGQAVPVRVYERDERIVVAAPMPELRPRHRAPSLRPMIRTNQEKKKPPVTPPPGKRPPVKPPPEDQPPEKSPPVEPPPDKQGPPVVPPPGGPPPPRQNRRAPRRDE
jgi:hypothetical protein